MKKALRKNYGLHDLTKLDFSLIKNNLKSNVLTNGKNCVKFEEAICKVTKSKYSVVCNNGTSALMMALLAILNSKNIKKPVIIVPNINFVAIANITYLLKGNLVLCDVNKITGMIDYDNFKEVLKVCKKKKIKPNLFFPIHYAGNVMDLSKIKNLCKRNMISIIEDGCHSFGSSLKIKQKSYIVGDCKNSYLTTFSFHPVKNITTIEGGAITTNNFDLYKKLLLLRSHSLAKTSISDPYKLIYPTLNFRMGEVNACIGLSQIKYVKYFRIKRNKLIEYYLQNLKSHKKDFKILNFVDQNIFWHLFVLNLSKRNFSKKATLMKFLKSKKIGTQIHYKPLFMHQKYKKIIKINLYKNSLNFYKSQISLPLHTQLNKSDIGVITRNLKSFFN